MDEHEVLAYFLEHLWTKGFKLTDEEVRFIYFGKKYTNASVSQVKLAVTFTLQLQLSFDRSFYISLLELFEKHAVVQTAEARQLLIETGMMKEK
ncbi:hypothetical protein J416_04773 [Gracilibacillus halophilus YIM-C55.5]|uniref:Uncharacterized protein n=1 Tax=Gracilibacillus halophilus YIM-C55.5 TaxID=1308866 RepID=N4WAG4_9BACI|nr:DUF6123 family protein [Gracilibacillus halophilus]ENH97303.1 hypothetical protein J416_04773 [Gracilibacillus halophilus YIM-C55.5]